MRKKRLGFIFMVILLGALAGSAVGEILGLVLPDGVVKDFFIRSASFGIGPTLVNLVVLSFTFGFTIKVNFIGVFGMILFAYLLRWID